MKKIVFSIVITFFAISSINAQAGEVFTSSGKAIKGFDVVAFYKDGRPSKGSDSLSWQWKEATWLFSSQANLDSFKVSPERYAPQYGGYCAYGTAEGHKAPTETDTWTIINGKLYFNYNKKVKEMWSKKQGELIKQADQQWPSVKNAQ